MPLAVADLETVVFPGAVGITAKTDQVVRLVQLKVGEQVYLFGFCDLLWCDIGHYHTTFP